MRFRHTHRPGFLFGLIDFCTVGLFFLFYMPLSGLQDELNFGQYSVENNLAGAVSAPDTLADSGQSGWLDLVKLA